MIEVLRVLLHFSVLHFGFFFLWASFNVFTLRYAEGMTMICILALEDCYKRAKICDMTAISWKQQHMKNRNKQQHRPVAKPLP
jgi:hypothetical protein